MKFLFGFLIGVLLFSFVGCSPKVPKPLIGTDTIDSIVFDRHYEIRDTVVISPPASVGVGIDLSEINEDLKPVSKSDKQANLNLRVEKGKLFVDCDCDTIGITAALKDTYQTVTQKKVITNTVVQAVRYVPWYMQALAWIGGISLASVGFMLAFRRK